jgi:prepilin-type N-terminal cleavage/methylation domain-containing protein
MTKFKKSYIRLILLAFKPKSSGYTLLESLMALVVVGILITSVAPMLALTTASRVQARRVDQATQALRAYIDGVRGGVIPIPQKFVAPISVSPPTTPALAFSALAPNFGFPPSPSLSGYPTAPDRDPGTLVDTNGNGFSVDDPQDLVIQAIRPIAFCTQGTPAVVGPPAVAAVAAVACPRTVGNQAQIDAETLIAKNEGFQMVLRVYRADAFSGGDTPDLTEQSNVFIGSIGSRKNPLVSTTVEVYAASGKLSNIKNRN